MKFVIFGLTISSSWGNGHATLWRGLVNALIERGHRIVFFERDTPYYAASRDLNAIEGGELILYSNWPQVRSAAFRQSADADVTIVTSYCPDAIEATDLMAGNRGLSVFYDLDTPITLSALLLGSEVGYIGPRGLSDFDLVLSYTGGRALDELRRRLGAKRTAPLYGHVDPRIHTRTEPAEHYRADLSYIGTYAADRQAALDALFLEPARRRPERRFLIAGAQYPADFPWGLNVYFVRHLPPSEHATFYSSSRLTLNVTRHAMAAMGWCPSGRLFEAAACGTPILSDAWEGLETFFEPGSEVLVARDAGDAMSALDLDDCELRRIAKAAQERAWSEHSSSRRAEELLCLVEEARAPLSAGKVAMEA